MHKWYSDASLNLQPNHHIFRSSEPLTLNQWHWIKLSRTGLEGILEIDDKVVAVGQSQGAFTQLTLTQNLFIGGHRNFDETAKLANISQSFDGCIQKVCIKLGTYVIRFYREFQFTVKPV